MVGWSERWMQMISRANGNNWEDEDRIWSISRLLLRIVGTGIPLLRCFITKQKSSGVYRIGIYPYVRAHTYTCVLQYKLLTTQSRGENISKKLQSGRCKLYLGRPREYWESNCFFIRSNILIDSIRLPMNYSFKEEWPFLRREIYLVCIHGPRDQARTFDDWSSSFDCLSRFYSRNRFSVSIRHPEATRSKKERNFDRNILHLVASISKVCRKQPITAITRREAKWWPYFAAECWAVPTSKSRWTRTMSPAGRIKRFSASISYVAHRRKIPLPRITRGQFYKRGKLARRGGKQSVVLTRRPEIDISWPSVNSLGKPTTSLKFRLIQFHRN